MLSNSYYITELLRVRVVESFLHQEIGFFDNTKKAGGAYLADVVAADPKLVATNVCNNMVIIISTISALTAALIVGFIASPKLAGVAIATFVFMAPGAVLESQVTMSGDSSSLSEEDIARGEVDVDTTAYILLESMQNIKTVQAYSLQELMLDRYCKLLHEEMIQGYKRGAVTGAAWGLSQFLQFACQAVLMWYGARLVSNGELDTSGMMRGSLSLMMAAMSLGMNAMFAGDYGAAKKAASRLYELMDRSSRVDSRDASGQHILALKDSIDLEGIHFRYPMRIDQPVYNGVSFSIKSGETVALVGASGCGKSTAIQLIQRFYVLDNDVYFNAVGKPLKGEAGSGTIRVDNTPIDQLNVQAWRRCIGFVQQEPVLFTTSVKENIALGRFGEDVDQTDIENAAKMANAHNFIEQFEDRYDTNVGKRGGQLSGGQKQRVAIARALVRNPSVLILDEATSALDAESERVVQAALDQVIEQGGRTTIVIAHRLSTIRKANKIVVLLNDGNGSKVVEMGTHDELIRIQDGVYSRLAQLAM
ncbi:transporter ATP-binding cassette domain protein [Gregarina niphandrodes]|uniref:Transporter ATP-binding cassette domain protein n=1 Tax=Gregarina niphandrodes TaxID=110365 RepID=A0A023B2G9_GRENI|nr:transporter ATP-binding cassette domain protein [Gregarina niphandrodes]EZG53101.1 transporter ATP-binding cassette domain protein [Gregarina niphandrodes]|eukprot:XP_011131876.1 transporter ATP-binding cassette domain protein [Gregarina niphandrodes]